MFFRAALNTVFIILIIIFTANNLCAERYNEDTCFKSYVSKKGENLAIAVNRETGRVELCWSDTSQAWLKPGEEEQSSLQKLYNKKIQLREMQDGLDQMHNKTWYTTSQDIGSRRSRK